ncbi:MAG TPA: hypothetical protein VJL88_05590 [Nitrospira sp.]|nr:hypothetical protein [Nitrospira sp.]
MPDRNRVFTRTGPDGAVEAWRAPCPALQLKQRDYHHSPNKDEHGDTSRAEEIKSLPVREAEVVVVHGSVKSDVIHVAVDRKIATVLLVEIILPNLRDNLLYGQKANRDKSRRKNDDLKYQQAFLLCDRLQRRQLVSSKITGDVSRLSELVRLRSLRFEGKNKLDGWGKLASRSVENFEASHYPCKFARENFPKLENYVINAYRARDPFYEEGGDHDALGDEFAAL